MNPLVWSDDFDPYANTCVAAGLVYFHSPGYTIIYLCKLCNEVSHDLPLDCCTLLGRNLPDVSGLKRNLLNVYVVNTLIS